MRARWFKTGFILAGVGSAIGLGNIWRFPYIVGESGGGTFLIPYFIAILFFGIPVMLVEFAVGRHFRGSVLTSLKRINPKIALVGLIPITAILFILSYYLVVTGWTFAYFFFSLFGQVSFGAFTETIYPLFFFLGAVLLVAVIVRRGIKKGIERTCRFLLPLLLILILVLVVRAISLPGAREGIKFYLTPNLSVLSNPHIWLLACGQAFFSLSAGFGILLTYGSYLSKKEGIPGSVFKIAGADTLIAILAGFIIFPIVFSFGFNPAAGPELVFVTLPEIFLVMWGGKFFGAVFFLLLFVAAITSAISMLEVGVTTLVDERKFSRTKATVLASLVVALVGVPSALSYAGFDLVLLGRSFLDLMDLIFGSLLTPVVAALFCVAIGWFWKPKKLLNEINRNSSIKIPLAIVYLVKYVIPVILLAVFLLEMLKISF